MAPYGTPLPEKSTTDTDRDTDAEPVKNLYAEEKMEPAGHTSLRAPPEPARALRRYPIGL